MSDNPAKRAVVVAWGDRHALPVDCEDQFVIEAFTTSQCHSLARAIHRLTGWQLCVMGRVEGPVAEAGDHVVCRMPDGRLVDIEGAWDQNDRWKHMRAVTPVSESTVRRLGWDGQNIRAAMPFARQVVEKVTR